MCVYVLYLLVVPHWLIWLMLASMTGTWTATVWVAPRCYIQVHPFPIPLWSACYSLLPVVKFWISEAPELWWPSCSLTSAIIDAGLERRQCETGMNFVDLSHLVGLEWQWPDYCMSILHLPFVARNSLISLSFQECVWVWCEWCT